MNSIKNFIWILLGILDKHFWIVVAVIFFMFDDMQFAAFSFAMAIYDKLSVLVDVFDDDDDNIQTVEELAASNKEAQHVGS